LSKLPSTKAISFFHLRGGEPEISFAVMALDCADYLLGSARSERSESRKMNVVDIKAIFQKMNSS